MEKVVEARVRRFVSRPLEFWPFQKGLTSDERAVRGARAAVYVGLAYAYQNKDLKSAIWPVAFACCLMALFGRPTQIHLDDASLKINPNPAGNAAVGDLTGRSPETPATPSSMSMTDFVGRMAQPLRNDDYAIIPVAAPNQAHQIFGDVAPLSDLASARRPVPIPARS